MNHEELAAQLRKPEGASGLQVAANMNKRNRFLYEVVWNRLQPATGEAILEIGFGNGQFFPEVMEMAASLELSGLDFSEEMYRVAVDNNQQLLASGRLTLKHGDSNQIPYADQAFHKVYCVNVIYFWQDPAGHLAEIFRVLKPGGRFYTGIRSRKTMQEMPFTQFGFTIYSGEEWGRILSENGFKEVVVTLVKEPTFDMEGAPVELESVCIEAQKP